MKELTEKAAIKLLKKHSTSAAYKHVLLHSNAVRKLALKIASKIKNSDRNFISTASLLHDIGRFKCPPWKDSVWHGVVGAKILRKEGLPKHALVAERHVGSGITKAEAKKIGLPIKSYLPKSKEEKIICYADKLVFGRRIGTLQQLVKRYKKEIGEAAAKRALKLHREIKKLQRK